MNKHFDNSLPVQITELSCAYSDGRVGLNKISFHVGEGQRVGICGKSSTGKTMLLQAILNLPFGPTVRRGTIRIFGQPPERSLVHSVGYVPENPESSFLTETVREELAFGPTARGWEKHKIENALQEVLHCLPLKEILRNSVQHISWSEKRILSIAAMAMLQPPLLVLDSPFGGLSEDHGRLLSDYLSEYSNAVLLTGNNPEVLGPLSHALYFLRNSTLVEGVER